MWLKQTASFFVHQTMYKQVDPSEKKRDFAWFVQQKLECRYSLDLYWHSWTFNNSRVTMLGHSWVWTTKQKSKNHCFPAPKTNWWICDVPWEFPILRKDIAAVAPRGSNGCWVVARCWCCKASADHRWSYKNNRGYPLGFVQWIYNQLHAIGGYMRIIIDPDAWLYLPTLKGWLDPV